MEMKLKSLNYSMDIVGPNVTTPSIFLNPGRHNINKNKKTGHRRFYMNDNGLKKFREFILEQWNNNFAEFEDVWNRITKHQGEIFHTIRGLKLKYEVKGDKIYHNRTKPPILKSDFKRIYQKFPIEKPSEIQGLVRGSAYVYAILSDERISN